MKIKLLIIVIFFTLSNIKTSVSNSENLDGIILYCECLDTSRNCIDDINAQGNENKVELRKIEEFRNHIIQFFGENVREFNFKLGENNKVEISANERKFRSTINKIHLDHSKSLNFKGVDYIDRETLKYIYKWEVTPEFDLINQVSQCEKVGTTFFFDYIGSAPDKQKSLDKLLSKNQF